MSTWQSVPPRNPETAIYWNTDILLWDLKWGVLALVEYSWGSTAWIKLPSYSESLGATTQWLVPELARVKLAWDCLWLQSSLGSNWPWFSTPTNADVSSNILPFAAWSEQPQTLLQRPRGNCATALHHKTESTSKLPAVPLERFIQSQDRSCQP